MLSIGLQNVKLLVPSQNNKVGLRSEFDDSAIMMPLVLRKLFTQDIQRIKTNALQVKQNMIMREEELSQCRE